MTKMKIGDFLHRVKNAIEIQNEVEYKRVTIKSKTQGISLRNKAFGKDIGTKKQFVISKGLFLLSKIDARFGAFGIVPNELDGAIITGNFWAYEVDKTMIDIGLFNIFVSSQNFIDICSKASSGTTHRKYLDEKKFLNFEINFPPIEEQKKIIETYKIKEEYNCNLQKEIQTQQTLLKKLRQSVLQEAIEGKLTASWREENPDVESASVLLEKIKHEKEQLIKEKKIKKQKPLPPISEDEIPFEIPDSWEWCRLGNVGIFERGKSKHRPRNDSILFKNGIYPFVQTGDVAQSKYNNFKINTYSKKYNKLGLAQSKLWNKGTFCITIAANIAETGFLDFDACFPDSVVGFNSVDTVISKYIQYFFIISKDKIEKYAPATAQKNINLGIISELICPLPSLAEQKEIVKKIENLFAICDELQTQIEASKKSSQTLMQAVLKEAFEHKSIQRK